MSASLRWVALVTWLALLAVAFFTAPTSDGQTGALVMQMVRGEFTGLNVSLFALFNLMGVWPMVFMSVLAFDTTEQRVWRWPFVLGSFAGGAFVLLPYLVLRRWGAPRRPVDRRWLKIVGSRWFALALTLAAFALTALFFLGGGLHEFAALFHTNQFVYLMSFDFIACSITGVLLSIEDVALRPTSPPWAVALLPAIGAPARLVAAPLSV